MGHRVGVLMAAGLLVLPGCASATDGAPGDPSVDLAHVHGLGVDPADGALHAGTHHGLFRVTDDGVEGPLGGLRQDFMGFTVAGERRFLASGHPGPGQPGPSALGLLESTDGGETWQTRSLAGEADFHALEWRHGRAWGLDAISGRLLTSSDLREWETIARMSAYDVAVSPHDEDTILVTSGRGPFLSTDGGASFQPMAGAAPVALVSWADDGTLAGIDAAGRLHVLPQDSDAWEERGSLGSTPEAIHAVDAETVYAAADGRLWRSTDGGATFTAYPS